jgi:hypothetical protein
MRKTKVPLLAIGMALACSCSGPPGGGGGEGGTGPSGSSSGGAAGGDAGEEETSTSGSGASTRTPSTDAATESSTAGGVACWQSCAGCCDDGGVCQPGTENGLCGVAGGGCATCDNSSVCARGACASQCTPNCAGKCANGSDGCGGQCTGRCGAGGCCDSNGNCQTGTTFSACGKVGDFCQACGVGADTCIDGFCSCGSRPSCGVGKACCPDYQDVADGGADAGSGACIDILTDVNNCGACGNACADSSDTNARPTCIGGLCQYPCQTGYARCTPNGLCTDTQSNSNACGGCGHVCPTTAPNTTGSTCQHGVCVLMCTSEYLDCDGDPLAQNTNGCETPVGGVVTEGLTNCGTCGHTCLASDGPAGSITTCSVQAGTGTCSWPCPAGDQINGENACCQPGFGCPSDYCAGGLHPNIDACGNPCLPTCPGCCDQNNECQSASASTCGSNAGSCANCNVNFSESDWSCTNGVCCVPSGDNNDGPTSDCCSGSSHCYDSNGLIVCRCN